MQVQIQVRPTGAYNGQEWPAVGEVIDLPTHVAEGMIRSGNVTAVAEPAPVETAIAPTRKVETAVKKTTRKR